MSVFPDDYMDILASEPEPLLRCDLDAIRQRSAAMLATLAAMRAARGARAAQPCPAPAEAQGDGREPARQAAEEEARAARAGGQKPGGEAVNINPNILRG